MNKTIAMGLYVLNGLFGVAGLANFIVNGNVFSLVVALLNLFAAYRSYVVLGIIGQIENDERTALQTKAEEDESDKV